MIINIGTKKITRNKKTLTAIIEFVFGEYTIYVFQGKNSQFDIFIKYKKEVEGSRIRTPQHLHWAVDMILKLQGDELLSRKFLDLVEQVWEESKPLENNDYDTLKKLIENNVANVDLSVYATLNDYGEYPIEFVYVLILLLATQEKTNKNDAYMFGKVVSQLASIDLDIFAVISIASPRRR